MSIPVPRWMKSLLGIKNPCPHCGAENDYICRLNPLNCEVNQWDKLYEVRGEEGVDEEVRRLEEAEDAKLQQKVQ